MYPTMTRANKGISNLLNTFNEDENINNDLIKYIIKRHPTKNIDFKKIDWIKMKKRPPYNNLALFYKYIDKEEDDISWKLCIRNIFGKFNNNVHKKNDIISAFRNESNIGTKKKYYINNTKINNKNIREGECNCCKIFTNNIQTDHYQLSFAEILDNFIKKYNLEICNIKIFENDNNEIKLKNKKLANDWLKYHDDCAKYRLLCKTCNIKFGNYGYKSK
tara:strand:- start:123 stop:779 length:657 start_codon:yes stop_codon:yes gene_type:complete